MVWVISSPRFSTSVGICASKAALCAIGRVRASRDTNAVLDRFLGQGRLRAPAPERLFNLQPGSDKAQSTVHHTSAAREQLFLRQRQRILLIANLDEKRKGIEGVWHGYNALLTLVPAKGKRDGTLHAEGSKWDVEDYKAYCNFTGDGKIESGIFKAVDEFPKLTRHSGTLVIDAESNDSEQPSYCWRMRSPKARLFPVKPSSGIEEISKQLRR